MGIPKKLVQKAGQAKNSLKGAGKAMAAGAAGAAVLAGNMVSAMRQKTSQVAGQAFNKTTKKEGIYMKKSTFVALLVALAAVAGVLGALYFYVLRREKELDEYEQLLFSEDFNDELPEDEDDVLPELE